MLRTAFGFIVIIHGLVHLLGFVKAFRLADVSQLTQDIAKPTGLLWLLAASLFIIAALCFLLKKESWWMIAVPAIVLSQLLILIYWQDARFGTIANAMILIAAILGFGAWNFNSMARTELKSLLAPTISRKHVVTREMAASVPPVVQKWLERSQIIGKEAPQIIHLQQTGTMRTAPDGKWMPFDAEQWFTTDRPGLLWLATVAAAPGIDLAGRDKYENGKGHMLIKLLSLFPVADAKGKEIDQGTMLRYLGEVVWFPSAALSDYIRWEQLDSLKARATMTYGGVTGSGVYEFAGSGDLVSFQANRYYDRKGGATLEDWHIHTEPDGYKEFEGVRIPAKLAVTWKLREGDFTWLNVEITDLHYIPSME